MRSVDGILVIPSLEPLAVELIIIKSLAEGKLTLFSSKTWHVFPELKL